MFAHLQMTKWTQSQVLVVAAVAVDIAIHPVVHQMMKTMFSLWQRNTVILATPTPQHKLQTHYDIIMNNIYIHTYSIVFG